MDTPRIQYTRTRDGVRIGYWDIGSGFPVVTMPYDVFGDLVMEWQIPKARQWYERLARGFRVVHFDARGVGVSQRDLKSLDAHAPLRDLEAVIAASGIEKFALITDTLLGAPIAAARRYAGRMTHMVAFSPITNLERYQRESATLGYQLVASLDWAAYARMIPSVVGVTDAESSARLSEMVLKSSSSEHYAAVQAAVAAPHPGGERLFSEPLDIPLLAIHHRGSMIPEEMVRDFVADQPNAQLVLYDGNATMAWAGDTEQVASEIRDLPRDAKAADPVAAAPVAATAANPFRTLLFTDIEGHTAMMQRLGDARGRDVLREHERITRECLAAHAGSEIKTMGDGFMASFGSAQRGLECAIALQRAFAESDCAGEGVLIRIGLNAGEPIAEDDDLFGASVILAARAAARAEGGQVLATNVVRELVAGKGFLFADAGQFELRGFEDPVRLYEVRWRR